MGKGDGQIDSRERCRADTTGMAGAKWLIRAQAPVPLAMIPSDPVIRYHNAAVSIAVANFQHDLFPRLAAFSHSLQLLLMATPCSVSIPSSHGSRIHVEASTPFRKKGVLT